MRQSIRIDVELSTDFGDVTRTLDLSKGVNYSSVRRSIMAAADSRCFILLEEFAAFLVPRLFKEEPRVQKISVTVSKLAVWSNAIPSVTITRARRNR